MSERRLRPSLNKCTLATLLVTLALVGCGGSETKERSAREVLAQKPLPVVPAHLRGTIGAEVDIGGIQPQLISGYGFVVGLRGTGGQELDERIARTMEREMAANGVGIDDSSDSPESRSPRTLLRDPNTAVVLVQAAIPPGAPVDSTFDVSVRALNASSLEGGRLWTTQLRLGTAQPFGGAQARLIGRAKGEIFISPFAESRSDPTVNQTTGRILDGGVVTSPLGIAVVLINESHARARSITSAINSRFPHGPGDRGPIAKGRNASVVEVTVPQRYREESAAFLLLMKHLRINQNAQEEAARSLIETLQQQPQYATEISWCLEAIGQKSLPFVRKLYESPDVMACLAALRVGARLGDATAAEPLTKLASTGPGAVRTDAINLLGKLPSGPKTDLALQELLKEEELSVRVAAYEALASRAERAMLLRLRNNQPQGLQVAPTTLEQLAKYKLPPGMLQGVERIPMGDVRFKFFLDIVPVGEPLIYVTQQGTPRVVLFGSDLSISRSTTSRLWNGRLMFETGGSSVRLMYRPTPSSQGIINTSRPNLPEFIATLTSAGSVDDPSGGFDLPYSDVVGALNELSKTRATRAGFATETERLKADLIAAMDPVAVRERPETPEERELIVFRETEKTATDEVKAPGVDKPSITPIEAPKK
jgi:flagellar basal body P-ring protein FlgI